jgi:hypothetical protein
MTIKFKEFINEDTRMSDIMSMEGPHNLKLMLGTHYTKLKKLARKYSGKLVVWDPDRSLSVRGLLSGDGTSFDYQLDSVDAPFSKTAIESTMYTFLTGKQHIVVVTNRHIIWADNPKSNSTFFMAVADLTTGYPELRQEVGRDGEYLKEECESDFEAITEVLSVSQRMQKKKSMRRHKAKVKRGQRRAKKRTATNKTIDKRSRRRARSSVKKNLAKGKNADDMSYSARKSLETRMKSRAGLVNRLAKRMRAKTRRDDRSKK